MPKRSRPAAITRLVSALSVGAMLASCTGADLASVVAGDPKRLEASHIETAAVRSKAVQPETMTAASTSIATATAPAPRDARTDAGFRALERGDPAAAEQLLGAVGDGPSDWRTLSGLGVATSMLGRQAEAQAHLKKALEVSPNNAAVLNNLAISYMLDRKPGEAEIVLKRVTATGAASRETLDNLALAKALKAQISAAGPSPKSE